MDLQVRSSYSGYFTPERTLCEFLATWGCHPTMVARVEFEVTICQLMLAGS